MIALPDVDLPVLDIVPELKHQLDRNSCVVLQAPPGAGKSTWIPLALLNEAWLVDKKIIMLEPRRLAAKTCACRMSDLIGEPCGRTVGFQIRNENRTSAHTRIDIMTEGIFTRKIQNDPELTNTGLVIFDEFHERNIHSDLGLALCLDAARAFRENLKILVMSATMDTERIAALLDDAPCIASRGRSFPVETVYLSPATSRPAAGSREWTAAVADAVRLALKRHIGDILVFLPGFREIGQVRRRLVETGMDSGTHVVPLHGRLSRSDQSKAIQKSLPGRRKIVLATSVAETSITIDGVSVVIDSGLMRVPVFSYKNGMTRLETVPVSRASARQRRGRAGRLGPGICYRLWHEHEQAGLVEFSRPEILATDLSAFALELAAWGVRDPGELCWLDPPPEGSFSEAVNLLTHLDALDDSGRITAHGKKIAAFGAHPRLAHMMIRAAEKNMGQTACGLAAILTETDFLIFENPDYDADINLRLEILNRPALDSDPAAVSAAVNRSAMKRVDRAARKFMDRLDIRPPDGPDFCRNLSRTGSLIAMAFPERVSQRRRPDRPAYIMASGNGAVLTPDDSLGVHEYIVAATLDGKKSNARIFLGAPYSARDLSDDFRSRMTVTENLRWDSRSLSVKAERKTMYGHLTISFFPVSDTDPEQVCRCLTRGIRAAGMSVLPWSREMIQLRNRTIFLRQLGGFDDLPDLSDLWLSERLDTWLAPFLTGITAVSSIKTTDLSSACLSLLSHRQRQVIDKNAPTHWTVPSGSRIPLLYSTDTEPAHPPILKVRIQEMFGLDTTPHITRQQIPLMLHLLSPAGRPVQITRDLASFWKNTYPEVKKDLMGRYPKHYWPDDPLAAPPTGKAKPRTPKK